MILNSACRSCISQSLSQMAARSATKAVPQWHFKSHKFKLPVLVCSTSGSTDVLGLEGMSSVSFGAEKKKEGRVLFYSSEVMIQCHV